jgi:hypothetical protein
MALYHYGLQYKISQGWQKFQIQNCIQILNVKKLVHKLCHKH